MIMTSIELVLVAIIAYIIGSIPTGYIIVKAKTGTDIRTVGSGSTGATNVKRVLGKKYFFLVMLLDALKGATPVLLAKYFATDIWGGVAAVIAAIAVIIGHSKSIFLKFKGGKSVASGVGTILALNFLVGLIIAVVWGIITYATKYVSVGSMIALLISPIAMYYLDSHIAYVGYCVLGAIYIVYLHRENIKRLINGNENKVR